MDSTTEKKSDLVSTDSCRKNEVIETPMQDNTLKPNGIGESGNDCNLDKPHDGLSVEESDTSVERTEVETPVTECVVDNSIVIPADSGNNTNDTLDTGENVNVIHSSPDKEHSGDVTASDVLLESSSHVSDVQIEEVVEAVDTQPANDNVRFETEVLVESHNNDITEVSVTECTIENDSSNLLNEINQSIELSEVLRSSDISDNVENNNCTLGQEVLNKEELLDILEGNDEQPMKGEAELLPENNMETKLALEQISRLRNSSKRRKPYKKLSNIPKKFVEVERNKKPESIKKVLSNKKEISNQTEETTKTEQNNKKEENIVHALVRDWEDEDGVEEESIIENISSLPCNQTSEIVDSDINDEKTNSLNIPMNDGQNPVHKSGDDTQPQRRLGRVIKKKIIFDPDNPDTYTKGKTYHKNKDTQPDMEQPPIKKGKIEPIHTTKSISSVTKLQWKKPSSKNMKQNKRLSEVDKLLMDEGAVNMIYQLTPEAPKGKKNMKTKAEFIKKIQSSTPEVNEMKFRERKKESCKSDDGEPKKLPSGKHRPSLSSSVKSLTTCEDFETHSADDSIIYRRHSSSSYSSTCMSPRRLSDVDTSIIMSTNSSQLNDVKIEKDNVSESSEIQSNAMNSTSNEIINKTDCLTIKRKLNSKLSLALTKRKRDAARSEKSPKKQMKFDNQSKYEVDSFKYLTLKIDQRVAEIHIQNKGDIYNTELLNEITQALSFVNVRKDISVTLLSSDCGTLCSELDLKLLLNDDGDTTKKIADEIMESVRDLLLSIECHSKLVCTGAWGACSGLALALVALSDVAVAAESASFVLARPKCDVAPVSPGLAALSFCHRLQQSLVDDLVIFGRQLSSFEAYQGGLVNRTLPSPGFQSHLLSIVTDIANQPTQNILLKKKLLNLGKMSEDTFMSRLDSECALMVEYWTSKEGQKLISASIQE